jgi:hypothetical protein
MDVVVANVQTVEEIYLSVAAKKCTILAGRKRRWSGYGLATAAAA